VTIAAVAFLALGAVQDEGLGWNPVDWARGLDDLDLSLSAGEFTAELSGELQLQALVFGEEAPGITLEDPVLRSDHYKRTRVEDGNEIVGRVKLTGDGTWGRWLTWSLEGRADRGAPALEDEAVGARMEQYWVRLELPDASWAPRLTLGKFAAPLGNFIPRHEPFKSAFSAYPLPYDQMTSFGTVGDTAAQVLGRRDVPDKKDWRVPIWREVYGTGAMLSGQASTLTYAAAVMNSAPGTWGWDWGLHTGDFRDPNVHLRAAWAAHPSTTIGATWSRGPYERQDADGLPKDRDAGDFPQTLAGVDVQYSRGDVDVFAEAYWTRFDGEKVGGLDLWGWYVESRYTLMPGLFAALRFGQVVFGEIRDAGGEEHQWDRNVHRVEFGGGYSFAKNMMAKTSVVLSYTSGGREPNDHLWVTEWILGF
jgi:hypothetical protein